MSEGAKKELKGFINIGLLKSVMFSVLIGAGIFITGLVITAFTMFFLKTDVSVIYWLSFFFLGVGSFVSGRCLYKKERGRGITTGLVAGILFFIFVLVFSGFIIGWDLNFKALSGAVISSLFGALGGINAANS